MAAMRRRPLSSTIGILLLLPLQGCCTLARFFCGPDRSEWVSIDWSTPQKAVATLLESLRRDNPQILYDSLSESYRRELGITSMTAELVWPRFRDANPGLHVAGYAEVPIPTLRGDDRAEVTLDIEGTIVDVRLVREVRTRILFQRDDSEFEFDKGQPLQSFSEKARIIAETDASGEPKEQSQIVLEPIVVTHPNLAALPLGKVWAAGIVSVWRIESIRARETP